MAAKRSEVSHKGFYFFLDAWMGDTGLQQCSYAAKGLWFDMLSRAWFQEPRGVLPGEPKALAQVMGVQREMAEAWSAQYAALIGELEDAGVFSRGRHVNDSLPENAIVNRRMFRGWMAENGRVEQAKKAASVRWGKPVASMLNDAQGYADRECSGDAQRFGASGGESSGSNVSPMLNPCSGKMLSGCLSPTPTLNTRSRSTVTVGVGGVGEGAQTDVLAERLAAVEAIPGLDQETKRDMVDGLRKRYGNGPAKPSSAETVGLTAQRLTVDLARSLDESKPTTPTEATANRALDGQTGRAWKPASRRQRGELVERCIRVTGDGKSRRNWWNLVDVLCPTQEGESRLLSVLLEFEDRMRRRDPADAKPDRPGAVLNSRLRAVIDELNLQPRRKGK